MHSPCPGPYRLYRRTSANLMFRQARWPKRLSAGSAVFVFVLVMSANSAMWAQNADPRTGVTLFQEGKAIGINLIALQKDNLFQGSRRVSDPLGREVTTRVTPLNLSYGITANLTVALVAPYISRTLEVAPDGGTERLGDSGLGDITALGKWRFLRRDRARRTSQLAFIGGVEFPTGSTDEVDSQGRRLPPSLQLGSSSYDFLLALADTEVWGRFVLAPSVLYKLNREGSRNFEEGDLLTASLFAQYRFYQAKFPGPEAGAGAGLSWERTSRSRLAGAAQPDSGGTEVFLNVGFFYAVRPGAILTLAVQLPIQRDLNGEQLGAAWRLVPGFEYRF